MSERHTTITTAELPEPVSEQLMTDLREFFPDATGGTAWQLTRSPPAWVEIIANLTSWETVFKVGATATLAATRKATRR